MKKMILAMTMALVSLTGMANNEETTVNAQTTENRQRTMANLQITAANPYLQQIRNVQSREELMKVMCELDAKGLQTALFGLDVMSNPFDASEYIMEVKPCSVTLPWVYYAKPNVEQQSVVDAIRNKNKELFKMAGCSDEDADGKMQMAWIIEHQIGIKTHEQTTQETDNMMSWTQLLKEYKGIDWAECRDANGYSKDINMVIVPQPEPLRIAEYILSTTDIEHLKAYMELHVIKACKNSQLS